MEDKNKHDEELPVELKTGSGALLAAARKQQNRTVEEIAAELNLSVTQIKTIELDQSEGLPEPTYVRGYIRSYAKLVGLNPEQVLENYLNPNWQQTSSLEDLPKGLGRADHSDSRGFFSAAKVITFLVIVGALGFLWFTGILGDIIGSRDASSRDQVTLNAQTNDQSPTTVVQNASNASIEETSVATSNTPTENQLVLNFGQTSWVDIRDGDDNRLAYKSYAEGESLEVSSAGSMSVFIGNAEGVSAQYNGEEFDISEYREGVYAKFNLGEE